MAMPAGVKAGVAALLSAAAPGAPAHPPDAVCAELRAIVAAAQEAPPFASLSQELNSPRLGFEICSVLDMSMEGDDPNFGCAGDDPGSAPRWDQLNADIVRCLPGAERYQDPGWSPRSAGESAHFRLGRVRIHTYEQREPNRSLVSISFGLVAQD